ncbi:MAG: hypothetical protein ACOC5G_03185 [Acidobacteriota bacterium]
MILKLLSIPILFFIPGFLLYNLLVKEKFLIDFFETLFIVILTSLIISGWTGLILAELGHFSLLNLSIGLVIFSLVFLILIFKFKINLSFKILKKPKITYKSVFLIILLAAGIKFFFPPGENITLHQDDVVIVNHGANIAQTGSILGQDPIINEVKQKNLFYDFQKINYQFPGFGFYFNQRTQKIMFYYLDFYPVLLAVFYSIFGASFFLYLTPLLALLSVISVYMAAKHMFSWEVGILSSLFLTFSFPQIWFARYPCAEILNQLLIFSGLFMVILLLKHKKTFFAFLSGFIFSTLILVRLDSLFTALAFVIFVILLQVMKKLKRKNIFILSFSFLIPYSWALMHNYMFDKSYIYIPSKFLAFTKLFLGAEAQSHHLISFLLFYGLPVLLLLIALPFIRHQEIVSKSYPYLPDFNWKKIRCVSLFLIAGLFIFLYITKYPYSDGLIGQKQTLLIIQSFLTPVGLLLSIMGLIIIVKNYLLNPHSLRREKSLSIIFFVLIAFPHFIYYIFLFLHNQPVFPWGFRRYLPIIFPFFTLCLSCTLAAVFKYPFHKGSKSSIKLKNAASKIVSLGLACFLFISMLTQNLNSDLLIHREFEGLIKDTQLFSSYFDEKSILLFFPTSYSTGISAPLKYIYHRNAVLLPKLEANHDFFRQIALWKSSSRPVYIISNDPGLIRKHLSKNCQLILRLVFPVSFTKMDYAGKPALGSDLYGEILEYKQDLYVFEIQSPTFDQEYIKIKENR